MTWPVDDPTYPGRSVRFQLINARLSGRFASRLRQRRRRGDSWRQLAEWVTDETGVPVTFVTIRQWAILLGIEHASGDKESKP